MDVITLDGRAYAKLITAGSYFLEIPPGPQRSQRLPCTGRRHGHEHVPTARQAALEAGKPKNRPISEVAAAAAEGALMGARGNSGVIISQMLRGFAHHVRHRAEIDTFMLATGMREAVQAARQALVKAVRDRGHRRRRGGGGQRLPRCPPREGFLPAGQRHAARGERGTRPHPGTAPVLKEAGVVDSGGAGSVYFLEGVLRFLPDTKVRTTAFPRRPVRQRVFTQQQVVGENKYLHRIHSAERGLFDGGTAGLLQQKGESLIVAGAPPTIKVHMHTDSPEAVQNLAAQHGYSHARQSRQHGAAA